MKVTSPCRRFKPIANVFFFLRHGNSKRAGPGSFDRGPKVDQRQDEGTQKSFDTWRAGVTMK
jgi:hypothetical protein